MEEFDHWDQISTRIDKAVNRLVRKTAFDIEHDAKSWAPVDTGFLKASIYARTENISHDAAAFRAVVRKRKGLPGEDLFPEVPQPDHNEAYVAVGATYGLYVEYGTVFMAAHPFMTPAVEAGRMGYSESLRLLFERLGNESVSIEGDIEISEE